MFFVDVGWFGGDREEIGEIGMVIDFLGLPEDVVDGMVTGGGDLLHVAFVARRAAGEEGEGGKRGFGHVT